MAIGSCFIDAEANIRSEADDKDLERSVLYFVFNIKTKLLPLIVLADVPSNLVLRAG